MIALLKYGNGMPFYRMEGLQENLGIPMPASTQWDIVNAQAERIEPAFEELVRQAAQGDVVHNDDTTVKILELMEERARQEALAEDRGGRIRAEEGSRSTRACSPRASCRHTTVHKIALFLSGRQHAGENLEDVLARRAADLPPPIQMCDALSRNLPGKLKTILGNCLAHGRRQFVDVVEQFPEECRHVLEALFRILSQRRDRVRAKSFRGGAIALSPSPAAVRPWRNFMPGLAGSSTSGEWNRTQAWAGPSLIC